MRKTKNRMSFPLGVTKINDWAEKSSAPYQICFSQNVLVYFLLLWILFSLSLHPTSPWCPVCACRHHSSAFSHCLHADGCRDYACHFRLCAPYWSVSCCVCTCLTVCGFQWFQENGCIVHIEFSSVLFVCRAVLCQHHGDCWHVRGSYSHCPSVSSSQSKQWANATLGEYSRSIFYEQDQEENSYFFATKTSFQVSKSGYNNKR